MKIIKKLICITFATLVATGAINAHLITKKEAESYIKTFLFIRDLSDNAQESIVTSISENLDKNGMIESAIAKTLLFEETNASEDQIAFFETLLIDTQIAPIIGDSKNNEYIDNNDWITNLQDQSIIYNSQFLVDNNSTFIAPPMCEELYKKPIVQLLCNRQKGQSCGYHAVINAKVLQDLSNKTTNLHKMTVIDPALQLLKKQGLQEIEAFLPQIFDNEVVDFAKNIALDQYAILQMNKQNKEITFYACKNYNDTVLTAENNFYAFQYINENPIETIIEMIQNNKHTTFLCCSGYHWTTFAITKNNNGYAYVIFLNSTAHPDYYNGPLESHLSEYAFAKKLIYAVKKYNKGL